MDTVLDPLRASVPLSLLVVIGCGADFISDATIIEPGPADTQCGGLGGVVFRFGEDDDGNGRLSGDEVEREVVSCNQRVPFISTSEEIPALEMLCSGIGGTRFRFGEDLDGDGVLDTDEIQQELVACNQRVDGAEARLRARPEMPGANCTYGGVRYEYGLDINRNGALDDSEVNGEDFACNGGTALIDVRGIETSTACPAGGLIVTSGMDRNVNGALDAAEVERTEAVCNGAGSLTEQTALPPNPDPSAPCSPFGGVRIASGLDLDGDGQLAAAEVVAENDVCTVQVNANLTLVAAFLVQPDTDGQPVPESVLIPRQQGCRYGGVLTQVGRDDDDDGELDAAEVDNEVVECNEVLLISGQSSLITQTPANAGECPAGGVVVRAGRDVNRDDELQASEVTSETVICNGFTGIATAERFDAADARAQQCGGTAGVELRFGVDRNGNGGLEMSERTGSALVCDGADGVDGLNGADGLDGLTTLVTSQFLPTVAGCGAGGGVELEFGLDLDDDGQLQAMEVTESFILCGNGNVVF